MTTDLDSLEAHVYAFGEPVWVWEPFYERWERCAAGKTDEHGRVFAAGRWLSPQSIRPRHEVTVTAANEIARLRAENADLIRRVREAERERNTLRKERDAAFERADTYARESDARATKERAGTADRYEGLVEAVKLDWRDACRERDALRAERDLARVDGRMMKEAARRLGVDTDGLKPAHVFRAIETLKRERDALREHGKGAK